MARETSNASTEIDIEERNAFDEARFGHVSVARSAQPCRKSRAERGPRERGGNLPTVTRYRSRGDCSMHRYRTYNYIDQPDTFASPLHPSSSRVFLLCSQRSPASTLVLCSARDGNSVITINTASTIASPITHPRSLAFLVSVSSLTGE
jgi:hypothetical protein